MPAVFVSYRHGDSDAFVARICAQLDHTFGGEHVLMRSPSTPPGQATRQSLGAAVSYANVMLIMIGPRWATTADDDWRFEVEHALTHTDTVPIVVLLKDTPPPTAADLPVSVQTLSQVQTLSVRDDPSFADDMAALTARLSTYVPPLTTSTPPTATPGPTPIAPSPSSPAGPYTIPQPGQQGAPYTIPQPMAQQPYGGSTYQGGVYIPPYGQQAQRGNNSVWVNVMGGAFLLVCIGCCALVFLLRDVDFDNIFAELADVRDTGPATSTVDGVTITTDLPRDWRWRVGDDDFLYVGNDTDAVLFGASAVAFDPDDISTYGDVRMSRPGTVVGLAPYSEPTTFGLDAYDFAQAMALGFRSYGVTARTERVSFGENRGGRVHFGDDGYTRMIDIYDYRPGTFIMVVILSDHYTRHEPSVRQILTSMEVD